MNMLLLLLAIKATPMNRKNPMDMSRKDRRPESFELDLL